MELTPQNTHNVNIIIDEKLQEGFTSVSLNLQNELFEVQNSSSKWFFRNLFKKSSPTVSFSKVASTYDIQGVFKNSFFTDSLPNARIISERYDQNFLGVEFEDCVFDDFVFNFSIRDMVTLSYNCLADYCSPFNIENLSIEVPPENLKDPSNSVGEGLLNQYLHSDMIEFSCSNPKLSLIQNASLRISNKKKLIKGVFGNNKIWKNPISYSLSIDINDVESFVTQDVEDLSSESFTLKIYYDREKTWELLTFQLDNCALSSYTEGISESGEPKITLNYKLVDELKTNTSITFGTPPIFPIS